METRAILRDSGAPPRKVRLVLQAIKGRRADEALAILQFLPNGSAPAIRKLLQSAIANAENNYRMDPNKLYVINAIADEASTQKRSRWRSRGRWTRIMKRQSHITIVVSDERELVPHAFRKLAK